MNAMGNEKGNKDAFLSTSGISPCRRTLIGQRFQTTRDKRTLTARTTSDFMLSLFKIVKKAPWGLTRINSELILAGSINPNRISASNCPKIMTKTNGAEAQIARTFHGERAYITTAITDSNASPAPLNRPGNWASGWSKTNAQGGLRIPLISYGSEIASDAGLKNLYQSP